MARYQERGEDDGEYAHGVKDLGSLDPGLVKRVLPVVLPEGDHVG
jgi:hypothetical protein